MYNININKNKLFMKKILTFLLLLAPTLANAQPADPDAWGFNDFSNSGIALGSRPVRDTIGGVVNIVLGFLGILTTVAILWGGFNMMTSGGNAEKSEKGKGAVTAGVIGLIIVLTAYAISRFVLNELYRETV